MCKTVPAARVVQLIHKGKSLTPSKADFRLAAQRAAILPLCGIVAAIDGFDTQVIGFTGRLIATELHIPQSRLGLVFTAGQLGAVIGAMLFGALADRVGRRRMLIASCFVAALFTGATLRAHDLQELLWCRALTGLALGGALPCLLSLVLHTIAADRRAAMTAMLYAMFPAGAVVGALASAPLIAAHGWRSVFIMAATLPATAGFLLLVSLREMPVRQNAQLAAAETTNRIAALFTGGRATRTIWLWLLFILVHPGIVLLALWMPALLQMLGVSPAQSSLLVASLNFGAVALSFASGWLMQRIGVMRFLLPVLILGAMSWIGISLFHADFPILLMATTAAGCLIGGAMTTIVALCAVIYPEAIRATGIGWALGVSRAGQMTAPLLIGRLLGLGWPPESILLACGAPVLLAVLPLIGLRRAMNTAPADRAIFN